MALNQVVKGNQLYCATNSAVFSVSSNNSITRYSKVTGLNDLFVSAIGWDDDSQQLLIAYNNSNLDVLKGSIVKNIGDIKRSSIAGNKTINSIYCKNGLAYLGTGLGIVIADLNKYEIKDTWFIGTNAAQINVTAITSDANYFYAATSEGLKKAAILSPNLSNPNS